MTKPGQSSFRRILLSRILLISIPVLLAGEFVTYTKARDSLLETARQNLTESAVRKGENIHDLVEAMRSSLAIASEAFPVQPDQPDRAKEFITLIARRLSPNIQCVQLTSVQTQQVAASSCSNQPLPFVSSDTWLNRGQVMQDPLSSVQITPMPQALSTTTSDKQRHLNLVFSAPVYDGTGRLQYVLSIQVAIHAPEISQRGSLSGVTVVLDQDGTILAHPIAELVGRRIQDEPGAKPLETALTQALGAKPGSPKQDLGNLVSFEQQGSEWLAGYKPIQVRMTSSDARTWVVLAVSPLKNTLSGLEDIKHILIILTLGLLTANLLATLYMSSDLAQPIEQLSDYALHLYHRHPPDPPPKNFKIKELNQLSAALDSMVTRLEERAEELEAAWQEAQAANQLKSEFLATTSHELRTPLNAIIGCVRLVKDGCCDSREEELEFLQQSDDAAIHLLKIINDLLDIAKIEAGKVELNLQPISIQELCQQCLRMVQPGAEKKHLSLELTVDAYLNHVPLDERRVRQMIINLLSNAVKFTPEGGQVRLDGHIGYGYQLSQDIRPDHSPINDSTPYLCLEVQDSGIGIPQERWHLLFRPFQQVDSSLTRKHEGTGLGLALTKRLAELHGGTISFQSSLGKGSTFRIWLPAREF